MEFLEVEQPAGQKQYWNGAEVDLCEGRAEGNIKGGLGWMKEWKLSFGNYFDGENELRSRWELI